MALLLHLLLVDTLLQLSLQEADTGRFSIEGSSNNSILLGESSGRKSLVCFTLRLGRLVTLALIDEAGSAGLTASVDIAALRRVRVLLDHGDLLPAPLAVRTLSILASRAEAWVARGRQYVSRLLLVLFEGD